ncbi:hypothetical protein DET54_104260 [Paenibacillus pabuli]|uniref:DUF3953 domain-containing protein n=1 Tax=Paenibacillus pabuli TaxID=1472 RepID=A0ABX9BMC3_9BACL|nr:hypothetical protein DET54_104260 [Paenibacillus pabuli]SEN80762.1 hypothetical protein SAMN05518670_2766 [Paenibacillus sp. OK076]
MRKRLTKNIPIWFLFVTIVVFILLCINFVEMNTRINMLAMVILSIANTFRLWKNERQLAMIFLLLSVLCTFFLIKSLVLY